ncbi:TPA: hypothetical protein ACMDUI_004650 [Vibrio parahaemolyticus]|nr:hypothetical protein [Vibrio parahaemolyticus]EGR1762980.1 hypothetical protein [Vibrio parahaemolyticus]
MKITTDEFERYIAIANRADLSKEEYQETKAFFLKCQTVFTPPHAYIPRVSAALQALEHHQPENFQWYQKPLGLVVIAASGGVLTYAVLLAFGWVPLPQG